MCVEARGWCQISSWAILCLMKLVLLRSLSWLTNEIQGSACLCLPRAGSQAPPLCLALVCLGSRLSSSHLNNKCLTYWTTFLVPFFQTLSLFRSLIVQSVIDCLLWSLKGEGMVHAEWKLALLYLEELQSSGRQLMLNWKCIESWGQAGSSYPRKWQNSFLGRNKNSGFPALICNNTGSCEVLVSPNLSKPGLLHIAMLSFDCPLLWGCLIHDRILRNIKGTTHIPTGKAKDA